MPALSIKPSERARHPVHDIAHAHDTKFLPRRFTATSIAVLKPRAQRDEVTDPVGFSEHQKCTGALST
jgi:hypothetical protein